MLALLPASVRSLMLIPGMGQPGPVDSIAPLLESYTSALQTYPLTTKVSTAAVLAAMGDAIAQQREGPTPYDQERALSFTLFDAAYRGGFQHLAFPWIIDTCRGDLVYSAATQLSLGADQSFCAAVEATALNQLVIVPLVYYPLFFSITGAVQGLTKEQSLTRAKKNFVDLTLRNWRFWIPAQYVQFAFLSVEWQVPYTCAMGLVWNVILSAAAGSARDNTPSTEGGSEPEIALSKEEDNLQNVKKEKVS